MSYLPSNCPLCTTPTREQHLAILELASAVLERKRLALTFCLIKPTELILTKGDKVQKLSYLFK